MRSSITAARAGVMAELGLVWGLLCEREVGVLADLSQVLEREFDVAGDLSAVSEDFEVCFVTLPERVTLLESEGMVVARCW